MTVLRRFLVLGALLFWQGGFTFYASVVVPLGQALLGSLRQGFLTRQVTNALNLAGLAALLLLIWDLVAEVDSSRTRRWARLLLWMGMLLALAALFDIHIRLDSRMQQRGYLVTDPEDFRLLHRIYLWITTAQWLCAILYLYLDLQTWKSADARQPGASQKEHAARRK